MQDSTSLTFLNGLGVNGKGMDWGIGDASLIPSWDKWLFLSRSAQTQSTVIYRWQGASFFQAFGACALKQDSPYKYTQTYFRKSVVQ